MQYLFANWEKLSQFKSGENAFILFSLNSKTLNFKVMEIICIYVWHLWQTGNNNNNNNQFSE